MKKILAIVLALTLVLGMNTVAFAKSRTDGIRIDENKVYSYDAKAKKMSIVKSSFTPGQTYYYLMENVDNDYAKDDGRIKTTSALENYRLSYSIIDGKKAIQSVGMVVKDVNSMEDYDGFTKGKYAFIAVTTKESYTNEVFDVDIEIKPTAKGSSSQLYDSKDSETKNMSFNFYASVGYDSVAAGSYTTIDDNTPVVNFDDVDDTEPVELYFGDKVEFHVNAKGQQELFLKYTDDPTGTKMDLVDKYPDANLEYHIFVGNKKTFRRTGSLYIGASSISDGKAPYVYEIDTDGKLTQVKPKYDTGEEKFNIQTATLKNYVISDVALRATSSSSSSEDEDEDIEESSSSSSTPKPPAPITPGENDNPATGPNDMMSLAVALTAAAFVTVAAASRKRK